MNPDDFTAFMKTLQTPEHRSLRVTTHTFLVPDAFQQHIMSGIMRGKRKKSPGPGKVWMYMVYILLEMFLEIMFQMWSTVGCMGFVPSIPRCGVRHPCKKNETDASIPANNRSICLVPVFTKVLWAAPTAEIDLVYTPLLPSAVRAEAAEQSEP